MEDRIDTDQREQRELSYRQQRGRPPLPCVANRELRADYGFSIVQIRNWFSSGSTTVIMRNPGMRSFGECLTRTPRLCNSSYQESTSGT